jgi:hypothetical protein
MFIIPFIHNKKTEKTMNIDIVQILCIGGKGIWEESDDLNIDTDILLPNEIFTEKIIQKEIKSNQVYFCKVDTTRTKRNEFYNWDDISLNDNETFVWRTFYNIKANDENTWLRIPKSEKIGNFRISSLLNEIVSCTPTKG